MPRTYESLLRAAAAAVLAGCLAGGPAWAAAPPCRPAPRHRPAPAEDDAPPSLVGAAVRRATLVLVSTMFFSPRARPRRTPPPDKPQPLIVQPPPPPVPDDHTPVDPPPQLQEAPEPGTAVTALVGGTLGLMAWWRHRRRRKVAPAE